MKRERLFCKLRTVAMGILLLSFYGFNHAEGAEWKLFQATQAGHIYYFDSTSVKHFPNGLIWVWVKIIETMGFTEEELKGLKDAKRSKDIVKRAQGRPRGEWEQLFEINCSARMARTLTATLYHTDGSIKEDYELPSEWVYVSPESVTHHLIKIICH